MLGSSCVAPLTAAICYQPVSNDDSRSVFVRERCGVAARVNSGWKSTSTAADSPLFGSDGRLLRELLNTAYITRSVTFSMGELTEPVAHRKAARKRRMKQKASMSLRVAMFPSVPGPIALAPGGQDAARGKLSGAVRRLHGAERSGDPTVEHDRIQSGHFRLSRRGNEMRAVRTCQGSCHCGAVRFEIRTDVPELTTRDSASI